MDNTLASPELTNYETILTLVNNQIIQSLGSLLEEYTENVVEKSSKEMFDFLGMLRSASMIVKSSDESKSASISSGRFLLVSKDDVYFSFLPLAHIFDLSGLFHWILAGGIMDKISSGGLLKIAFPAFLLLLVFDKIKQGFGGRVRLMFSGVAPLPQHVEEFLRVACCSLFSQGYGA
ncbi:eukaryotic long-chain fatty acid CoA synthetase (LC-FACS) [Castilleja foliolosa]|uniref:Eukaryotic long-chain fatty acid CoA synthetase (LC-FACS) n=1 Tax=Castilleja foliolosa TaxID=1961234 RepID=A0ABD3DED4_9LAMI